VQQDKNITAEGYGMTRFLSDSLQAKEPFFRAGLRHLESTSGHPNTDIRFSTHVRQATQAKIRELGLDPNDTTPEELYHALQERIKADDARLNRRLRTEAATHVSAEADVVEGMVRALKALPGTRGGFALKHSTLRSLFKKVPPKRAMKQLGYRSLDSFLKHETPVSVLAAAWLSEGVTWQHKFIDQYKHLSPTDFESRPMTIMKPKSRRWRELGERAAREKRHTILSFKEAGALVLLPLPEDAPSGSTVASLTLALHEVNRIRAAGTFLKICQVRPDFGDFVKAVAADNLETEGRLLDRPITWDLIQRYYARLTEQFREELFGPHIRLEDMAWQPIEESLSAIEPGMDFWKQSAHLGVLQDRSPVSMNVVDVALNYCNKLPFEHRVAQYFRQSLWHELSLQYLPHETVERTVMKTLQPDMAEEMAIA
jgi:hypothetical protein